MPRISVCGKNCLPHPVLEPRAWWRRRWAITIPTTAPVCGYGDIQTPQVNTVQIAQIGIIFALPTLWLWCIPKPTTHVEEAAGAVGQLIRKRTTPWGFPTWRRWTATCWRQAHPSVFAELAGLDYELRGCLWCLCLRPGAVRPDHRRTKQLQSAPYHTACCLSATRTHGPGIVTLEVRPDGGPEKRPRPKMDWLNFLAARTGLQPGVVYLTLRAGRRKDLCLPMWCHCRRVLSGRIGARGGQFLGGAGL